jgi:uncharacterized protein (TIGR00369 family)
MPDSIDLGRYQVFVPPDPFEDHTGPFYFKIEGDARRAGSVHCVLPTAAARHANYAGAVHGGAILTFADYALCLVAGRAADEGANTSFAMTVSIAVEFLAAARLGAPLEADGEPLQVTGRMAFARGHITQEGKPIALWSGVCRHLPRVKAMARKEASPSSAIATPQTVPADFELLANASVYSRHIGPSYARKETDGASLIQPTSPHMCNTSGVLHGGYMMSFADSAVTRAAGLVTGLAPSTISFAAEFLAAGDACSPLATRVEIPRHGKTLAFLRGLLEQNGQPLLSYSATILLRPRG